MFLTRGFIFSYEAVSRFRRLVLIVAEFAGAASMSDGTITAVDPRALIWWHGVPLCRRPQPDPPQPKRPPGMHFRRGVYLTDEQLEMYRLLRRKRIPVATALKMAKAPRGPSGLSDLTRLHQRAPALQPLGQIQCLAADISASGRRCRQ
jgi:hypothetical protein